MMSSVQQSNAHPEPSGRMGVGADIMKSSKQHHSSKRVKETVFPTQAMQSLNHQEMLKAKSCISKPYGGLPHELKRSTGETLIQPKVSGSCQQMAVVVKAQKDDELVKYMSNLPGYLQRMERTNVQDKALNVGVLDWSRLENWKFNQRGIPMRVGNNASLASSNLSTRMATRLPTFYGQARNETLTSESKLRPPPCRRTYFHNGGISQNDKSSFQDVENASKSHFDGQKRAFWNHKSFDKNSSETVFEKGKQRELDYKISSNVENRSSNSSFNRSPTRFRESLSSSDRESKQRIEGMRGSDINRKAFKQKSSPSLGASSSKLRSYNISPSAKEKKNVDDSIKKRMELQEPEIDFPLQHQVDESKNIVLLVPVKKSQSSPPEQQRRSIDENLTGETPVSMSESFSDKEVFSSDLHYEIPHSCPLLSRAEIDTEQQEMAPHAIDTHDDMKLSPDVISSAKVSNENALETSRTLDQETAELSARKGRHPPPNRRFSFSVGRMTRSFSFKESSSIPKLSSTYASVKSGPVISKASAGLDFSNREKGSVHNRARSSPLRRILDPLLKLKGSTMPNSTGSDQSSRGSVDSCSYKPINATELLQYEKFESSNIQAQLIVTSNNGFPLFKFVINNKNIIVAAPMKNLTSTGKSDQGCNYVLYAIDEIKRKGGSWINQVGKEKSCGFVYKVAGHMKVNGSSLLDLSGKNSSDQYMVQESVLFGVEQKTTGQASTELMPNTELAAVVVKKPSKKFGCDKLESDKETNLMEKDFSWCLSDNEHFNSCTVILPGGIHSVPSKGIPSSLIHRWRSGGSCDCGGWDVGCKLHILSTENKHQKLRKASYACLTSDHFELFVQREPQQDMPIFSMESMEKGKYSVEFSPSISSLRAFFICISVISCQKLSDLDEVSTAYMGKVFHEYGNADCGMKKIRTTVVGDAPAKYAPCPPVSPVGRV